MRKKIYATAIMAGLYMSGLGVGAQQAIRGVEVGPVELRERRENRRREKEKKKKALKKRSNPLNPAQLKKRFSRDRCYRACLDYQHRTLSKIERQAKAERWATVKRENPTLAATYPDL